MGKNKKQEDKNGVGYEWEYANKIDTRTTWEKMKDGIYDPSTHAFMGRTAKSWGAILLFYAIFYSALALMFAICMKILMASLDDDRPRWIEKESLIGANPGLGFRPMSNHSEGAALIRYKSDNDTNIKMWTDDIHKFFEKYQTTSSKQKACDFTTSLGPGEVCSFNLSALGNCYTDLENNYRKKTPCIILKLNKIIGWTPEYYKIDDLPEEMPPILQQSIQSYKPEHWRTVWLNCIGETVSDKQNIGPVLYYPKQGFSGYYFPYENLKGYHPPVVAVKFLQPRPHVSINIECRAWAKNIHYKKSSHQREGSVHFELLVE